jgi:hypothetical protein
MNDAPPMPGAAAPAVTPPPAATPPPETPPAQPAGNEDADLEQSFRDLDSGKFEPRTNQDSKPGKPAAQPAKPAEPPKEAAKPPGDKPPEPDAKQKPADKPEEKPKEKPGDTPAESKQKRPWEIVREKEKTIAELTQKYTAIERELAELKSKPSTPAVDAEKEKLRQDLKEAHEELRYANYSKHPEYTEKFEKPYNELAKNLTAKAMELVVDDGEQPRALTAKEFWEVIGTPSLNHAIVAARRIFPDDPTKATQIVNMRNQITDAWNAMEAAKREYKEKGAEREKEALTKKQQEEARAVQADQERAAKWRAMNEAAVKNERLKEFFVAAEDDPKGKELLTKGMQDADLAFNQGKPLEEGGKAVEGDDLIELWSGVRNKAGAFNYVAYRYRMANARIAELEKELADYKASEPAGGKPAAGATEPEIDETERALRELDGQ